MTGSGINTAWGKKPLKTTASKNFLDGKYIYLKKKNFLWLSSRMTTLMGRKSLNIEKT